MGKIWRNYGVYSFLVVLVACAFVNNAMVSSAMDLKNEESTILIGPYTQWQEYHSIHISWETRGATLVNLIRWGTTPSCDLVSFVGPGIVKRIHHVQLSNLAANTQYYYQVESDGVQSPVYQFSTRAVVQSTVHMAAFGDSRGVWDGWRNASIVSQAVENESADIIIHTGDIVRDGINRSQWVDFFTQAGYTHNSTFYPTLGNHEQYGIPYFRYFTLPGNERWYSFEYGPVHFVCLDSNFRNRFNPAQLMWLIRDLRRNHLPFTIVFFHHPVYSSGSHGSEEVLRRIWQPFFERNHVDVVLNGHDHHYERGLVNDIHYIVTGGGGAPLRDVGSNWWTEAAEKTYHYCRFEINNNDLFFEAVRSDGSIIDTFTLSK